MKEDIPNKIPITQGVYGVDYLGPPIPRALQFSLWPCLPHPASRFLSASQTPWFHPQSSFVPSLTANICVIFFSFQWKWCISFLLPQKWCPKKFPLERTGNRKFPPIWSPFLLQDRLVVVLVLAPNSPGKSWLSWMLASTQVSSRIQRDEVELFVFLYGKKPPSKPHLSSLTKGQIHFLNWDLC